ncbi:hypothetical protein BC792_10711 [Sphingobacterium allocomposti]|uniref:Uncharacterized protein n=2 Tax=Sphingobacterium allocomposti TaxID=415956 RepID=A0A5S5DMS4_9SPHI|nr:hypothetical protein BC792_10711 [Sphingobacterium composti Yoo et al. 2007 non Ten et al. 2007]
MAVETQDLASPRNFRYFCHMNTKWIPFLTIGVLLILVFVFSDVSGQCAMCTLNAENSTTNGNTQGKGLNDGILFLLAIPYLIAVGIGILWYKKYRKSHAKPASPFDK